MRWKQEFVTSETLQDGNEQKDLIFYKVKKIRILRTIIHWKNAELVGLLTHFVFKQHFGVKIRADGVFKFVL